MLFLPIIERELRLAARNWRTYYGRVWAGGAALGVCFYLIWMIRSTLGSAATGGEVLTITSILALAICLFSGVNRTCDCISSEKRDDTLGLLFLTHLKGYDVVLGKLFVNSLHVIFILIGVLPILSVPVFLGGVNGAELVRIPVALLNSLALGVSVGILVSALTRSQRAAHLTAGVVITVLAVALPVAAMLVQRFSRFPELAIPLSLPSPSYALQMAFGGTFGLRINLFWTAIALQMGISVTAIVAACLIVPRSWQVKAGAPWRFTEWLARLNYGGRDGRARRRGRMLDRNPIFWLRCRDRFGPLWPILFAVASLGLGIFGLVHYEIPREPAFVILIVLLVINDFAMRIRVGTLASVELGQDRQSGALEMILSTPLTIDEILKGQWMAIQWKLLWTYVPLLLIFALVLNVAVRDMGGEFAVAWFFLFMSVGDFINMGYVGMWKGMRMRNVQQAKGSALLRVVLLPWMAWLTLMPMPWVGELLNELGPSGFFLSAVAVWSFSTLTAARSARRNLTAHFREAATDRFNFERRTGIAALLRKCSDTFLTINLLRTRRPPVLN